MDRSEHLRRRAEKLKQTTFRDFWTLVAQCASILRDIAPGKRKPWLQKIIDEMYYQQAGLCGLCGKFMQRGIHEVDHIIPFVYGGGNERGNIQLAHIECNREKRTSVDPENLLRYLEDRYMNLA